MPRRIEAEADQRWTGNLQAVRDEWSGRLQAELAAAATESERRVLDESNRSRMEAERTAAESVAELRAEFDRTLATERERFRVEHQQHADAMQAERERTARELEQQKVTTLTNDDGSVQESETPASWPEAVQILGRHASAFLAHLTAVRAAEGMRPTVTASGSQPAARARQGDGQSGVGRGFPGGAA
jgi:hypothetical protein